MKSRPAAMLFLLLGCALSIAEAQRTGKRIIRKGGKHDPDKMKEFLTKWSPSADKSAAQNDWSFGGCLRLVMQGHEGIAQGALPKRDRP